MVNLRIFLKGDGSFLGVNFKTKTLKTFKIGCDYDKALCVAIEAIFSWVV